MRDVRERTKASSATMIGPSVHGVLPEVGKGVIRRAVGASVSVGCFSDAEERVESFLLPSTAVQFLAREPMSDERLCVVKLTDEHGVEHRVKVRAESVYEAALLGLKRLERVGWESDGSTIGSVIVEVWEGRTRHVVHARMRLSWLKAPEKYPPEEHRKAKLRFLAK